MKVTLELKFKNLKWIEDALWYNPAGVERGYGNQSL